MQTSLIMLIASPAAFAFINSWNDYLNPLPLAVASLTSSINRARPEIIYVCLVIMAIPSNPVYLIFQNQLGEGMTSGAVKG